LDTQLTYAAAEISSARRLRNLRYTRLLTTVLRWVIVSVEWYVTIHLGQLISLASLRGRWIEYRPVWVSLRIGVFTCVGWKIALSL